MTENSELPTLEPTDLNRVLIRAREEGWSKLGLLGPRQRDFGRRLAKLEWPSAGWNLFILHEKLNNLPNKLLVNSSIDALILRDNDLSDDEVAKIAKMKQLRFLDLNRNNVGDMGATAIASLPNIEVLELGWNRIGDNGAVAISNCQTVISLDLFGNQISRVGCLELIKAWASTSNHFERRLLDLRKNPGFDGLGPEMALPPVAAQNVLTAWERRERVESTAVLLPEPEATGAPIFPGIQISTSSRGRLVAADDVLASAARDDAIGRELHEEVSLALDRLIEVARRSNKPAETDCRQAAEDAKERLGTEPQQVRISAILRIERLRLLREADERRRSAADTLVEPLEAGVAAALGDALAAANFYIQTDPYLAEQQRLMADPELDVELTPAEADAAEADLEELDLAEPNLLQELIFGRETAEVGGTAGKRALIWLAASWRNVLRELIRQVLGWLRQQLDERLGDGKLGMAIAVDDAAAWLREQAQAVGVLGMLAGRATSESAARIWSHAEPVIGKGVGRAVTWGAVAFLIAQSGLLPRLGFNFDLVNAIQRLLAGLG